MGSPISPLGNVTNPLGSVIDGLLQGHQLALMMQASQRADQEAQTREALGQQQIQSNDEAARQNLMFNARPVNSAGMVQVDASDPRVQAATPGIADQAPDGARPTLQTPPGPQTPDAPPETSSLGQGPNEELTPPYPYPANPAATPAATPAPAANRLPGNNPSAVPQPGPDGKFWVKADTSRLVKYKDSQGNLFQGELYTPQEQAQRDLATKVATMRIGQTKISIAPEDAAKLGLASGDNWIPNADLSTYIKNREDNEQIPAPPGYPQKTVARKDYQKALEIGETARADLAKEGNVQSGQENQAQIAKDNRKAAETRARVQQDSANARNAASNATRITVAGMREKARNAGGGGATPNAQGVQGRFDQREIDNDTKLMEAAKTAQAGADARRSEIGAATGTEDGEDYADPLSASGKTVTMNALQRARLKAEFDKSTTLRDQKAAEVQRIMTKHGWGTPTAPTPPGAATPPPATPPPATPPPATKTPAANQPKKEVPTLTTKGGKTIKVGSQVPLANGKTATIKKLYANGTFDY